MTGSVVTGGVTTGAILIVAKAPVPGLAKTRLAPEYGPVGAARLAAAALLDTLRHARATGAAVVVSWHGDLRCAQRSEEISAELDGCTVVAQRGDTFADRLVHAHRDATASGARHVLQIGMDTPQIGPAVLSRSLSWIVDGRADTAWLGPAADGGWWGLGLTGGAGAEALGDVPMSRVDTAARTETALRRAGLVTEHLPMVCDVDRPEDVPTVAASCSPTSEFAVEAASSGTIVSAS